MGDKVDTKNGGENLYDVAGLLNELRHQKELVEIERRFNKRLSAALSDLRVKVNEAKAALSDSAVLEASKEELINDKVHENETEEGKESVGYNTWSLLVMMRDIMRDAEAAEAWRDAHGEMASTAPVLRKYGERIAVMLSIKKEDIAKTISEINKAENEGTEA